MHPGDGGPRRRTGRPSRPGSVSARSTRRLQRNVRDGRDGQLPAGQRHSPIDRRNLDRGHGPVPEQVGAGHPAHVVHGDEPSTRREPGAERLPCGRARCSRAAHERQAEHRRGMGQSAPIRAVSRRLRASSAHCRRRGTPGRIAAPSARARASPRRTPGRHRTTSARLPGGASRRGREAVGDRRLDRDLREVPQDPVGVVVGIVRSGRRPAIPSPPPRSARPSSRGPAGTSAASSRRCGPSLRVGVDDLDRAQLVERAFGRWSPGGSAPDQLHVPGTAHETPWLSRIIATCSAAAATPQGSVGVVDEQRMCASRKGR